MLSGEEKKGKYGKKFISLFTSSGNEIWTKVYTEEDLSIVQNKMSNTGKYILVVIGKGLWEKTGEEKILKGRRGKERIAKRRKHIGAKYYLEMFDATGRLIWQKEVTPANYDIIFSDSDDLVIITAGNTVLRIETETSK